MGSYGGNLFGQVFTCKGSLEVGKILVSKRIAVLNLTLNKYASRAVDYIRVDRAQTQRPAIHFAFGCSGHIGEVYGNNGFKISFGSIAPIQARNRVSQQSHSFSGALPIIFYGDHEIHIVANFVSHPTVQGRKIAYHGFCIDVWTKLFLHRLSGQSVSFGSVASRTCGVYRPASCGVGITSSGSESVRSQFAAFDRVGFGALGFIVSKIGSPPLFPKGRPDQSYTDRAQCHPYQGCSTHDLRPPSRNFLGCKVLLATLIFACGGFSLAYAIFLEFQRKPGAGLAYFAFGLPCIILGGVGCAAFI